MPIYFLSDFDFKDNGRRLVIGTDAGVFVGKPKGQFIRIIPRERVSQVDVLEDERILLVLAEKQLLAYGLEALDPNDPNSPNKRAKKLGSSVSFFKTGVCQNRTLVGIVKNSSNALDPSSTIKTLEPIEQDGAKKNKHSLRKMLGGGNSELFKLYKVTTRLCISFFRRGVLRLLSTLTLVISWGIL